MIRRGAPKSESRDRYGISDNSVNDRRHTFQENKGSRNSNQLSQDRRFSNNEETPWIFIKVHLNKGRKGYGFAFINDKSPQREDDTISITKIVHEGVAQRDGRLKIGDIIVSVNGVDFDEVPYETAIATLRNTGPNMTILVRRLKEDYLEADENDYINSPDEVPVLNTYETDESDKSDDNENFQQFEVKLIKRSLGGLGINIQGGYDDDNDNEEDNYITISKLAPNGVAAVDGRLQVGDIILQVDYQTFDGMTHDNAVEILKNTEKQVTIYVGRFIEKKRKTNKNRRSREID